MKTMKKALVIVTAMMTEDSRPVGALGRLQPALQRTDQPDVRRVHRAETHAAPAQDRRAVRRRLVTHRTNQARLAHTGVTVHEHRTRLMRSGSAHRRREDSHLLEAARDARHRAPEPRPHQQPPPKQPRCLHKTATLRSVPCAPAGRVPSSAGRGDPYVSTGRGPRPQRTLSRRVVRFVVRDGVNRWGSWGVVRRSALALVLVEAV
jgi:hypothetical protein